MPSYETKFEFSNQPYNRVEADALIIPVFQDKGENGDKKSAMMWDEALIQLDESMHCTLKNAVDEEKFTGGIKSIQTHRKSHGDEIQVRRVILAGMGLPEKLRFDKINETLQKAVESALKYKSLQTIAFAFPESIASENTLSFLQAMTDAVACATYKTAEAKDSGQEVVRATILLRGEATGEQNELLKNASAMASAKSFSKDLVNMPANLKTTDSMVEYARRLENHTTINVEVIDDVEWIRINMPAFYTVAMGSVATDPPKFIKVRYTPPGDITKKIALVGKSVIFDTGGYQIKPGDSMNTMKNDMTGGADVIGALKAVAELELTGAEITAYMAATPNKIDSHAMLPDMIVGSSCGKRIEIRHTDAEGRLTLIDAVTQAGNDKPDVILTIATLTGSAKRCAGENIALMGNDDDHIRRVLQAGRAVGDPIVALEVIEDDFDDIKSDQDSADIRNISKSKTRGTQTAAAFVMTGTPEGTPHVHLDIAGVDVTKDEKATGYGQKTLIQWVLEETKR